MYGLGEWLYFDGVTVEDSDHEAGKLTRKGRTGKQEREEDRPETMHGLAGMPRHGKGTTIGVSVGGEFGSEAFTEASCWAVLLVSRAVCMAIPSSR